MKILFQNKYFDYFITFFVVCQITGDRLINNCRLFWPNNFDSINFLTWEYSAKIGLIPIKDNNFPYGLLSYFKDVNIFAAFFDFLFTPLLFTGYLFIFKKIYNNSYYAYFSTGALLLFIVYITGFDVFNRYGILPLFAGIISYIFYSSNKILSKRIYLSIGIGIGLLIFLIIDQAIYASLIFILLLITFSYVHLQHKKLKESLKTTSANLSFFFIGCTIGFLPFLIYLLKLNALIQFMQFFSYLSDLTFLAKAPFINSISTPDNLFLLVIGIVSIIYSSYIIIFKKDTLTANRYFLISLVYSYLLLQQKSIIRSIAPQITFLGLLLFFSLFYELKLFLEKQEMNRSILYAYFVNLVVAITFIIGLTPFGPAALYTWTSDNDCFQKNIEQQIAQDPTYKEVKDNISSGKIFSFPSSPFFYILYNQKPPMYLSTYEASPKYAQQNLIQYIQKQKIDWVIYDYVNTELLDGVPDYIRATILHQYIINNFSIQKAVGRFLIFKYNSSKKDFFKDPMLNKFPTLRQELTDVNLAAIPSSEGYYKVTLLKNKKPVMSNFLIKNFNSNLASNKMLSTNTILTIWIKKTNKKQLTISINTEDGLETKVHFASCKEKNPCIINLSRLPIFYQVRQLKEISDENNVITKVSLYKITEDSRFW